MIPFHKKVQEVKDGQDSLEPICHFRTHQLANELLKEREINSLSFLTNPQIDTILKYEI